MGLEESVQQERNILLSSSVAVNEMLAGEYVSTS